MEKALETIDNAIEILNQTRSMFFADHTVYGGFKKSDFNKAINGLTIISAELEEAMKPKTCEWKQCTSEYDTSWEGTCGAKWTIEHGTPKENVVNFCPQCGGKLVEIEPKDNE